YGDGVITLIIGIVIVLIGIARLTRADLPSYVQRSPIVAGIAAGVVMGIDTGQLVDRIHAVQTASSLATASLGAGVYAVFVGAGLSVLGGLSLRSTASSIRAGQAGPGPVDAGQPAVPGVTVTHFGSRYFLGGIHQQRQYAIWDRQRG